MATLSVTTNSQLGISCIEANYRIPTSKFSHQKLNSPFHGVLVRRRPAFSVIAATSVPVRGNSSLVVDNDGNGVAEKEFEFKPSFGEYLKAMESVKSVREKHSQENSSKSRSSSRIGSRVDEGDGKLGDFEQKKSKSLRKHELSKSSVENSEIALVDGRKRKLTDGRKLEDGGRGNARSAYRNLVQTELNSARRERVLNANCRVQETGSSEENVKLGDFEQKKSKSWRNNELSKHHVNLGEITKLNAERPERIVWVNGNLGMNANSLQETGSSSRYEGGSFKMNRYPGQTTSITSGSCVMDHVEHKKISVVQKRVNDGKTSRSKPFLKDRNGDSLETERAAFNSLEELNDVCDKPRVSRVDMEERIQKLAKFLNGADINMPEWNFSKMMRSAKIRFGDHSVLRLIQILGRFGNWKMVLQVIEWIQSRERFKSHKIRYIYTAALDALGKARRPVEALNLFHAMQQHFASYPDLVAYHCIAVTLGQAGHMKELFDVIDSMQSPPKKMFTTGVLEKWDPRLEPDIVVYNAVLNACVHRKKWEGAFWVLQQIKQRGQQPSSTTYGLVMEVMFACGKYNLVHEFLRKAQNSFIPNALTYKVLVNTLWRQGKIDEAVLIVQDMERRGIIGSGGLYYDLARCLCSAGRCEEALMQIDKICKVANKPLVVTYTGLIQACIDSGNIQSGRHIFNQMQKFCSPNLVTYNIMLKGYLHYEMYEEAKQLFQKLLEHDNHVGSNLRYKDRITPDIHTFNLMLNACATKHQWDDLEFIYTSMLQHGFLFNMKRHLLIILDACRAGKVELLETTWKHIVREDKLPPPLLIKEMFRMKLEQDDYATVVAYIASLPSSESHRISPKSWLDFFRENALLFQKDILIRLVDEVNILIAKSDSPNIVLEHFGTSCKELLRTQSKNIYM